MLMNYKELKDIEIPLDGCFYAFSNQQFAEGLKNLGISLEDANKMIYRGDYGLYGTREGLTAYKAAIKENSARIATECDPQEVYDYEFYNHECGYINDDTEAMMFVIAYFGEDKARTVKRMHGYVQIDDIKFEL
jgi:hypothetical protein